jgi:hypothetical protein
VTDAPAHSLANASTAIQWDPHARVAFVRYTTGATLVAGDGPFLIDALASWIGADGAPFAVLADATGLRGTNAEYRATVNAFFREHRERASIAIFHAGPIIHVVVEMFRIATGMPIKTFDDEAAARAWLRTRGRAA